MLTPTCPLSSLGNMTHNIHVVEFYNLRLDFTVEILKSVNSFIFKFLLLFIQMLVLNNCQVILGSEY